jgi:hypothetical protein
MSNPDISVNKLTVIISTFFEVVKKTTSQPVTNNNINLINQNSTNSQSVYDNIPGGYPVNLTFQINRDTVNLVDTYVVSGAVNFPPGNIYRVPNLSNFIAGGSLPSPAQNPILFDFRPIISTVLTKSGSANITLSSMTTGNTWGFTDKNGSKHLYNMASDQSRTDFTSIVWYTIKNGDLTDEITNINFTFEYKFTVTLSDLLSNPGTIGPNFGSYDMIRNRLSTFKLKNYYYNSIATFLNKVSYKGVYATNLQDTPPYITYRNYTCNVPNFAKQISYKGYSINGILQTNFNFPIAQYVVVYNTVYVNEKASSVGADGTYDKPYKSINDAILKLNLNNNLYKNYPSDSVYMYVYNGIYTLDYDILNGARADILYIVGDTNVKINIIKAEKALSWVVNAVSFINLKFICNSMSNLTYSNGMGASIYLTNRRKTNFVKCSFTTTIVNSLRPAISVSNSTLTNFYDCTFYNLGQVLNANLDLIDNKTETIFTNCLFYDNQSIFNGPLINANFNVRIDFSTIYNVNNVLFLYNNQNNSILGGSTGNQTRSVNINASIIYKSNINLNYITNSTSYIEDLTITNSCSYDSNIINNNIKQSSIIVADPLFISPPKNFHVASNSPVLNKVNQLNLPILYANVSLSCYNYSMLENGYPDELPGSFSMGYHTPKNISYFFGT